MSIERISLVSGFSRSTRARQGVDLAAEYLDLPKQPVLDGPLVFLELQLLLRVGQLLEEQGE